MFAPTPTTRQEHEATQRRMLASAISRARQRVVMTSVFSVGTAAGAKKAAADVADGGEPDVASKTRAVKRSRFIEVAFGCPPESITSSGTYVPPKRSSSPQIPRDERSAALPTPHQYEPGEFVTLSFSSLFDYQWCPQRYYLRKVAGYPKLLTPGMMYGSGEWLIT